MKWFTYAMLTVLASAAMAQARDATVSSAQAIRTAIAAAQPGDNIFIKPGDYDMGNAVVLERSGAPGRPITLQAAGNTGYAKLRITATNTDVGLRIHARYWVLRGLHIEGNRKISDLIQMAGDRGAGNVILVDCKISTCSEFLIKGSRSRQQAPDNVVLLHCEWFDTPHTALDLPSGDNWVVRDNYVHNYGGGSGVSYGIFLKGGGQNGLIEGNFVDGQSKTSTVGISFGGGLTGKQWLRLLPNGKLAPEHANGICRNNIVVNTADVAYHTNNSAGCKFYNNMAYHCHSGYQRQGSYLPDAMLVNNVLSGEITNPGVNEHNLTQADKAWFVDPAHFDFRLTPAGKTALAGKGVSIPLKDNPVDYFGQPRTSDAATLGPVNVGATTSTQWIDARTTGRPTPIPTH